MATSVWAGALIGVQAECVRVEVDLIRRLPAVCIVGLAAGAIKEAAERVRSAVASAGFDFPRKRVIINLAPANTRKEGSAFDLPMAIGILAEDGQIQAEDLDDYLLMGELGLGADLRPTHGALSYALLARRHNKTLILPASCAAQASLVPGVTVLAARSLTEVALHLNGVHSLPEATQQEASISRFSVDMSEVLGQEQARRALELSAAGAHHLLMMGPPGCGKTMLARRLPTILPQMSFEEALSCTQIYSAAGLLKESAQLLHERPFRAPHHSVSAAGMVGSRSLKPGEVSLAHNGVLFLDEAPEFSRSVLEHLREPLQDGTIRITRAQGVVEYPASLTMILAANPCPCGHRGNAAICSCGEHEVMRYQRRLSGPLMDRIDLHVMLKPVNPLTLVSAPPSESSSEVRERVQLAHARQRARGQTHPNGRLSMSEVKNFIPLSDACHALLARGVEQLALSARSMNRVLKVSRTAADLDNCEQIEPKHLAEAFAFRPAEAL